MTTQEIFHGISTSELLSYLVAGDKSKELKEEITRRALIASSERIGKVNNTELDARYNG